MKRWPQHCLIKTYPHISITTTSAASVAPTCVYSAWHASKCASTSMVWKSICITISQQGNNNCYQMPGSGLQALACTIKCMGWKLYPGDIPPSCLNDEGTPRAVWPQGRRARQMTTFGAEATLQMSEYYLLRQLFELRLKRTNLGKAFPCFFA